MWWSYVNELIEHRHLYRDILHEYTLDHVERFLFEIRVEQLRTRIVEIQNHRISQIADGRKYQSQVNRLTSQLNRLLKRGARNLLTPQEQALLDKQDHVTFNEMAPVEKQRIQTEVDIMWGQIPEHLQDKAQKLAGLK